MFTLPLRKLKGLLNHQSRGLISKTFAFQIVKIRRDFSSKLKDQNKQDKLEVLASNNTHIRSAIKLFYEYSSPESIDWEEFQQKLNSLKIKDGVSVILQACLRIRSDALVKSFCNYLSEKRENLKPIELFLLIKLLGHDKDLVVKHESLIKSAYEDIKEYMESSALIRSYLSNLLSDIPSCYDDLIKITRKDDRIDYSHLALKALSLKDVELAFEYVRNGSTNCSKIFHGYVDYLCEMAKEKNFSPDMITSFIKLCEDNNDIISCDNFYPIMRTLVDTLNKHASDYVWTIGRSEISNASVCSKCKQKLIDKCISQSDLTALRKSFLPAAGYTDKNVFLNTSELELKRFLEFLHQSKPYNIVFDGLNILHLTKQVQNENASRFLRYYIDEGFSVLIVSKAHSKNNFERLALMKKRAYKEKCQFFFTENMSDDDLFVVYAALHGGVGTYLLTNDFLNKYGERLNDDLKKIFFKWKSYHQIFPKLRKNGLPPPHLGLPQLTTNEDGKKYIWHISHTNEIYTVSLMASMSLNWVCLEANKKLP